MSLIKCFQLIIHISLAIVLKLFLILRKLSALYYFKGYSYRKKSVYTMLRTYLRWISIESLLNSILHLILSLCKKKIYKYRNY